MRPHNNLKANQWPGAYYSLDVDESVASGSAGEELPIRTLQWRQDDAIASPHDYTPADDRGFIIPVTGLWMIQGTTRWTGSASGTWRFCQWVLNGSTWAQGETVPNIASANDTIFGSLIVARFTKDDHLDLRVGQNTGAALNVNAAADAHILGFFLGH